MRVTEKKEKQGMFNSFEPKFFYHCCLYIDYVTLYKVTDKK